MVTTEVSPYSDSLGSSSRGTTHPTPSSKGPAVYANVQHLNYTTKVGKRQAD